MLFWIRENPRSENGSENKSPEIHQLPPMLVDVEKVRLVVVSADVLVA
jgi:hypothetical protein